MPRTPIECAYPRCHRVRTTRNETGRLPSRRKWCYFHYNGEGTTRRKAWVAKQLAKEGQNA